MSISKCYLMYIDMSTTIVATARAFLLNTATHKTNDLMAVPDKRRSIVLGRIKRMELIEKAIRQKVPGVNMQVKWDGDFVKVVLKADSFPHTLFEGLALTSEEIAYVRNKKGVDFDESDVKAKYVFKAALDELQYKLVFPVTYKRAIIRKPKSDAASEIIQPEPDVEG